jgi:hypothetical protein
MCLYNILVHAVIYDKNLFHRQILVRTAHSNFHAGILMNGHRASIKAVWAVPLHVAPRLWGTESCG